MLIILLFAVILKSQIVSLLYSFLLNRNREFSEEVVVELQGGNTAFAQRHYNFNEQLKSRMSYVIHLRQGNLIPKDKEDILHLRLISSGKL